MNFTLYTDNFEVEREMRVNFAEWLINWKGLQKIKMGSFLIQNQLK